MLAARLEMDRHVAVAVIGIRVVVKVGRQAHIDSTERVDHVAKRDEVDSDVAIERYPGDLAHLVLRRISAATATGVLRSHAADDVGVRNLVRSVYFLVPDPA